MRLAGAIGILMPLLIRPIYQPESAARYASQLDTVTSTRRHRATSEMAELDGALKDVSRWHGPAGMLANFSIRPNIPRPSHHEEQVRISGFGQDLGLETLVDDVVTRPFASG